MSRMGSTGGSGVQTAWPCLGSALETSWFALGEPFFSSYALRKQSSHLVGPTTGSEAFSWSGQVVGS